MRFDFEAGKRFLAEGDILEALRCFKSALESDRSFVEAYVELAITYVLAFEDSGDPLCLDSARKVCLAGLKRDPTPEERRKLFEIQEKVEDLLLESHKAEADAMADAMEDGAYKGLPIVDSGLPDEDPEVFEAEEIEDEIEEEKGH
jgi:tetratricopeptide (TPR) repeat protein